MTTHHQTTMTNPHPSLSDSPLRRRTCLTLAAVPIVAPLLASLRVSAQTLTPQAPSQAPAHATSPAPSQTATDLKALNLPSAGVLIDFPPLADTGNAVPLHAEIQAPSGLNVTAVEVVLPENPNPSVIKIRLVEPQPRYLFTTRLRLAASQDAWVIATLSDGSRRAAFAPTIITSSACFDGT